MELRKQVQLLEETVEKRDQEITLRKEAEALAEEEKDEEVAELRSRMKKQERKFDTELRFVMAQQDEEAAKRKALDNQLKIASGKLDLFTDCDMPRVLVAALCRRADAFEHLTTREVRYSGDHARFLLLSPLINSSSR